MRVSLGSSVEALVRLIDLIESEEEERGRPSDEE